jgi:hypothetical protein
MIRVPLFDLKFLNERACLRRPQHWAALLDRDLGFAPAGDAGTSNRRH